MVGSVGVRRLSVQEVVSEVAVEAAGSWGRHSPTQDHGHCSPSQLTAGLYWRLITLTGRSDTITAQNADQLYFWDCLPSKLRSLLVMSVLA